MKIKDVMTRGVETARPEESIQSVAQRMAAGGFGFMPVTDGEKLLGAITDRDLTIRALAAGMAGATPVGEIMTRDVEFRREDDDLEEILSTMGGEQIRRLPILDRHDKLVGVVSLGDMATKVKEKYAGETLEDISRAPTSN